MLSAACLITGPVAVEEAVSVVKSRYNEGVDLLHEFYVDGSKLPGTTSTLGISY